MLEESGLSQTIMPLEGQGHHCSRDHMTSEILGQRLQLKLHIPIKVCDDHRHHIEVIADFPNRALPISAVLFSHILHYNISGISACWMPL